MLKLSDISISAHSYEMSYTAKDTCIDTVFTPNQKLVMSSLVADFTEEARRNIILQPNDLCSLFDERAGFEESYVGPDSLLNTTSNVS